MLHGDAYHKENVVQRDNRATITTGTVAIKSECNICMFRFRVILISYVGIEPLIT